MNNNRAATAIRRQHVWEYVVEGKQTTEIANLLKCERSTVSRDIKFMVQDSNKYLNDMAKKMLPFIFKRTISGLEYILNQCLERYKKDGNLFALKIAKECYNDIMNHAANGASVMSVRRITEKANSLGITFDNDNEGR